MFFDCHISKSAKVLVLFSALLIALPLAGQEDITIDGSKLPYSSTEKQLHKDGLITSSDIDNLENTCIDQSQLKYYNYHSKTYYVDAPVEQVWAAYKTVSPAEAWQGNIGSYAFMYSRYTGYITYITDEYPGIEVGQVIFLNLRFLRGLFNLAVAQEITDINDEDKILQFCYLENGASAGSQSVQLYSIPDGRTRVIHQTYYRSDSEFRDEYLYPFLHSLIIKEYHQSIAAKAEAMH